MNTQSATQVRVSPPVHRPRRLYVASCFTMVSIAFVFAIRGDIMPELSTYFHLTKQELGWIAGAAFWGYPVAILIRTLCLRCPRQTVQRLRQGDIPR